MSFDGEVLEHELAVAVEPRASHPRTIRPAADRAEALRGVAGHRDELATDPPTRFATRSSAGPRRRARRARARAPASRSSRSMRASASGLSDAAQHRHQRPAARADDARARGARSRARSPRRRPPAAGACAAAPGSASSIRVGERVGVDRAVHHLGVDEAEVGDARARAVRRELDAQRAAELLDGGLAHRVRASRRRRWERVDRGDHDDVAAARARSPAAPRRPCGRRPSG